MFNPKGQNTSGEISGVFSHFINIAGTHTVEKGYHGWNYTSVKGFPSVDLLEQNGTVLLCENNCLLELFEVLSQLPSPMALSGSVREGV